MGGFGSGGCERDDTKTTVQACLTFGVGNFQGRLCPASAGTLLWKRGETVTDFMVFDVTESEMGLCLRLHYRLGECGASGIEAHLRARQSCLTNRLIRKRFIFRSACR